MSKPNHSPAPWKWEIRSGGNRLVAASGEILIDDSARLSAIDTTGPDAKLIAAAPLLLAACKAALDYDDLDWREKIAAAVEAAEA